MLSCFPRTFALVAMHWHLGYGDACPRVLLTLQDSKSLSANNGGAQQFPLRAQMKPKGSQPFQDYVEKMRNKKALPIVKQIKRCDIASR